LSGVAIDQHFSQRGRQKDMTELMTRHPQLLGIGLDEATAIVVQKSAAEVVGEGKVFFYDRRQPVLPELPDYVAVAAGGRFDLVARKVIDAAATPNADETTKAAVSPKYDLVLRGGRVVDGTGNPWFRGDVAIEGERIAALGKIAAGAGKREVDASKLVVAPGFIDMHSHSDYVLLQDGRAESKIRQGVTTEVFGEGTSAGPGGNATTANNDVVSGGRSYRRYATLGDYFAAIEKSQASVNIASYVGIDNVWQAVMGSSHARPTSEQLAAMKKLVREAMEDGARRAIRSSRRACAGERCCSAYAR
jgi:hypothetical protein